MQCLSRPPSFNDGASECCRIFSGGSRHGRRNDGALPLVSLNMQQLFPYLQRHVVLPRRFVTLRNGPYLVPLTERRARWIFCEEIGAPRRGGATLLPYTSLNMQELFLYIPRYVTHEIVRVKRHARGSSIIRWHKIIVGEHVSKYFDDTRPVPLDTN